MADEKSFLSNFADGIGEDLKEKVTRGADLKKVFSEENLKKKRSTFWTCLVAGVLLVALALGAAVYVNAIRVDTFESLLLENVDYASLGMDDLSIRSFARETMFYLTGAQDTWNPQIVVGGFPASSFIPQTFRDHMATVRDWFGSAKTAFLAGAAIVLVLLGRAVADRKKGFSAGGYYLGAGASLAVVGGIVVWASTDFEGLWSILHKTLIPDGIFGAAEPIMQLFPENLFAGYLPSVATLFGILAAVVLVLPLILIPVSKLLTRFSGGKGTTAVGTSSQKRASTAQKSSSAHKTTTTHKSSTAHSSSGGRSTAKSAHGTKKSTAASKQTHASK